MAEAGRLDGTRILMTADAVGGVWTYALDLAAGLAERGAATTLAVLGPAPSDDQRRAATAIPGLDLVETGLPLDWTAERQAEIETAGAAVADLARNIRADLVHLNSPALAAKARFDQPVLALCHSCVATWWAAVRGTTLPADFAWRTEFVAAGYRNADALIAPSRAFARATAEAYGIAEPLVVHNGRSLLNLSERSAGPSPAWERDESAKPTGVRVAPYPEMAGPHPSPLPHGRGGASAPVMRAAPFVFTAGRLWDEGKNAALLDAAAAVLGAPVLAAGPTRGPNGAAIDLRHVEALGSVPPATIAAHLAERPIFCSPARYEPFGLAVLEAAEAGCALVLADIPTFRELWDGAAIFVSPDDAAGMARRLQDLLDDAAARERLGQAAREQARRYTVDSMVEGTLAVYQDLLAPSPASWPGLTRPPRSEGLGSVDEADANGSSLSQADREKRRGGVKPGHDTERAARPEKQVEQPSMNYGLQGVSR